MSAVSAIAVRRNGVQNVRGPEERLSSAADRVLRHPQNEELLSAIITLERKLPSPVARVQGNQLRPPMVILHACVCVCVCVHVCVCLCVYARVHACLRIHAVSYVSCVHS